jgi:glycosyltransferase involved in cell wall biosynthesis
VLDSPLVMWYNGVVSGVSPESPCHVGINAHLLNLSAGYRGAGISGYIRNLLRHLPAAGPGMRLTAFVGDRAYGGEAGLEVRRSCWPTARPISRIVWEQVVQPWVLWRERVDLLHALAFVGPWATPCPVVVTVYDLSFLFYPETFRPANRLYLRLGTRHSVQRARRVLAISESTRRDVARVYRIPVERIDIARPGVGDEFYPRPPAELEAFRAQRSLPDQYLLFVGTLEPRKNVVQLVEAYAHFCRIVGLDRRRGELPRLVLTGGKGWLYDEIFARVEALGLERDVLFPGYVPQAELPLWYAAAAAFVYPSLYEGFGLPALEAMASGTPVITSNISSLPEVVGDAAVLVDPAAVEALAEAMAQVVNDETLRASLRVRGLDRARGFTWVETARNTVTSYRRAMRGRDV